MTMKKAYFISDAHLGANYLTDKRANEMRVVRFLNHIKDDAAELYLLGDILDYWYEYKNVVPRGYTRFLGKLSELADSGVRIFWFTGNHDVWLFDYLANEIGLTVVKGATQMQVLGKTFLLSHGDDVGHQKLSYRITRSIFHNRVCQWLYAGVHPRLTYPLATSLSQHNRLSRSPEQEKNITEVCCQHLKDFSIGYANSHREVEHFVFGHIHLARQIKLDESRDMTVLGDWIDQYTYASFDGKKVELQHFEE